MYKKALFATDFDEFGIRAAQKAKKIADENEAALFLVHVVEPLPAYTYPGFTSFAAVEMTMREQAEKELSVLAKQLGVEDSYCMIEFGLIKNEILRVAQEKKIDLIITGSHGKHGLALLLGSTSHAILHGAACDVLIIHP